MVSLTIRLRGLSNNPAPIVPNSSNSAVGGNFYAERGSYVGLEGLKPNSLQHILHSVN